MLLVDEVTHLSAEAGALRARFGVAPDLAIFAGHFPGAPVYPGVLVVESLCQALLCLFGLLDASLRGAPPRLSRIAEAVFLAPVAPGDELELLVRSTGADGLCASGVGQARVGGVSVSVGRFDVVWASAEERGGT